jgi:hypothetical protein
MAPYTYQNPRRSSRLQNLPAINYSDKRSYTKAAVAKKAPAKKAAAKKKVLAKKAPIKKAAAIKAPVKKSTVKMVKQESSSSSSGRFSQIAESEDDVIPAAPAKKSPVKKIPPKDVKQESSEFDSDEFLDDEVSNYEGGSTRQSRKVQLKSPHLRL